MFVGMREQSIGLSPCFSLPVNIGDCDQEGDKGWAWKGCDKRQVVTKVFGTSS